MKFNREPTVWLQALSVLLTIVVSFGIPQLTTDNATAIVALGTAALGAYNAFKVRPVAPPAIIAVFTAGAALLTGYGLNLSQEMMGAITAAVPVLLTLIIRGQVTPIADPRPADQVVSVPDEVRS